MLLQLMPHFAWFGSLSFLLLFSPPQQQNLKLSHHLRHHGPIPHNTSIHTCKYNILNIHIYTYIYGYQQMNRTACCCSSLCDNHHHSQFVFPHIFHHSASIHLIAKFVFKVRQLWMQFYNTNYFTISQPRRRFFQKQLV